MSTLLLSVAAALYLAATIRFQRSLYADEGDGAGGALHGRGFVAAAFIAQLASLLAAGHEMGACPLTLAQSLNVICWTMVGLYLVVGILWRKMDVVGAFTAPAATLMMLASLATEHLRGPVSNPHDPLLTFHVACIVLGYAAFTLATLVAALFFIQSFLLKRKQVSGVLMKMPSLENLDQATYRLIGLGFVPMLIGIALGFARVDGQGPRAWSLDVWLGLATVLIYAVYIGARLFGGWQGRRVNQLLLLGFVFLVATYVGVGLPSSVHLRP
ncbi:MAG: hypothetical protein EB084_02975 [Proteobacteria bacterium]|nr:hypothetical protein [Pseudomonadota bacterium]